MRPVLTALRPRKVFLEQLITPLRIIEQIRRANPSHLAWKGTWPTSCTQFVVGAVGETDLDLLQTTDKLRTQFKIARAYYSKFSPVLDTPFENLPPANLRRSNRLYQAFYLLRDYQFNLEDIEFSPTGHLNLLKDPKLTWAEHHLQHQPIELNSADYEQLIKIPGIGPQIARKIILSAAMVRFGISATSANLGSPPNVPTDLSCWMAANPLTNLHYLMLAKKRKIRHFISEPISIHFDTPPLHPKSPPCPNSFTWQDRDFRVIKCLAEWHDFSRRGRMARNMQPQHATSASKHGSWGVGRFYFDVETEPPRLPDVL